jgi:hypothetical protein
MDAGRGDKSQSVKGLHQANTKPAIQFQEKTPLLFNRRVGWRAGWVAGWGAMV